MLDALLAFGQETWIVIKEFFRLLVAAIGVGLYGYIGLMLIYIVQAKRTSLSAKTATVFSALFPGVGLMYSTEDFHESKGENALLNHSLTLYFTIAAWILITFSGYFHPVLSAIYFLLMVILPTIAYVFTAKTLTNSTQEAKLAYEQIHAKRAEINDLKLQLKAIKEAASNEQSTWEKEQKALHTNIHQVKNILYPRRKEKDSLNKQIRKIESDIHMLKVLKDCELNGTKIAFDTNVLMKIDPLMFAQLANCQLIMSKRVKEELDNKKQEEGQAGFRGRLGSKRFKYLSSLKKIQPVMLENNSLFLKQNQLLKNNTDEKIIGDYLYEYKKGEKLAVLSFDTNFVGSAHCANIPVLEVNYMELDSKEAA